jgi:hypothetical protein
MTSDLSKLEDAFWDFWNVLVQLPIDEEEKKEWALALMRYSRRLESDLEGRKWRRMVVDWASLNALMTALQEKYPRPSKELSDVWERYRKSLFTSVRISVPKEKAEEVIERMNQMAEKKLAELELKRRVLGVEK